jgi:phosphotriesterase-related protein
MQAMSVAGPVEAAGLGVTIPHEHLRADARFLCTAPWRPFVPVEAIPQDLLRRVPMEFVDNLDMRSEEIALEEASMYARAGGATIVDLTPIELGRDPAQLLRISRQAGLNIIMATGYYVFKSHPPELANASVEEIAATFVREIVIGIDGVRAGVIGEIGTDDPLHPQEAKVLRAAAQAQLATGCPINIHFAAKCREVFPVLELLQAEGITDFSRVVISHMDVAIDLEQHRAVAERGAWVEYDTFGHEAYPDSKGNVFPRDEVRVEALAQLRDWGLLDRVLLSQDVCFKFLFKRFGGYGYTNLLERVRPMMIAAGLDAGDQHRLFVTNPARVFAFFPGG